MDDGRYTLAADDYFRLVAKLREVEVLRLEARLALQGPEQAGARMLAELAVKYGFDPEGAYRFEDASCTLVQAKPA